MKQKNGWQPGWGGIVPSIARLQHEQKIDPALDLVFKRLHRLRLSEKDIGAIAVTQGPGLSIALEVGIKKAKTLALKWGMPLIGVNHLAGHLYSPFIQNSHGFPTRVVPERFLSLLISGGHTQIVKVVVNHESKVAVGEKSKVKSQNDSSASIHEFTILGETMDDAAGEALDKAAKLLGLGYPGGPVIERLAKEVANVDLYRFPRPMIGLPTLDMSFSGLKTHLVQFLRGEKSVIVDQTLQLREIASAFQEAVFDTVIRKLRKAIEQTGITSIAVGGGVAANMRLRVLVRALARAHGGYAFFPPYPYLCGDNAAMIGVAAYYAHLRGSYVSDFDTFDRVPRLALIT
jgi:N6-L-threonylcarbamoyladenine synthase